MRAARPPTTARVCGWPWALRGVGAAPLVCSSASIEQRLWEQRCCCAALLMSSVCRPHSNHAPTTLAPPSGRYAGLLEATMDHTPNVCSIPPRELLDFCVDQG